MPIGWIGGKYRTSKPIWRMSGRRAITSSNVPCRFGSPDCERGNSSYQLANSACGRSTSTLIGACCTTKGRSADAATAATVSGAVRACTAASTSSASSALIAVLNAAVLSGSCLGKHLLEIVTRLGQLERDADAGLVLDLDLVAERRIVVAPAFDGEQVAADAPRAERRLPAVIAQGFATARASSLSRRPPSRAARPRPRRARR